MAIIGKVLGKVRATPDSRSARRIAAVVAILLGAALGAVLVRYGLAVPLAVAGALILGGTIACTLHEDAGKPLGA